jgi:hypothetical protein
MRLSDQKLMAVLGAGAWLTVTCTNAKPSGSPQREADAGRAVAPLVSASASPEASALQGAEVPVLRTRDFELRDWLAFGSGCRARAAEPGNVSMRVADDLGSPGRYRVRFVFNGYGIGQADPLSGESENFARECAIRLAIEPTAGRRLSGATAVPVFRVDKAAGPRVRLRARLFVGGETAFKFEKWFDGKDVLRGHLEAAKWYADGAADESSGDAPCGLGRIVGLSLSAAVFREDLRPYDVAVGLNGSSAEILLQFVACGE